MSRHKKAPLRQLCSQEQQELNQISRSRVCPAIEVSRVKTPRPSPEATTSKPPLGRPPLLSTASRIWSPVPTPRGPPFRTRRCRLGSIDDAPWCNDHDRRISSFGLIDRRIGEVTSRLDAICTFVTIDS